MVQSATSQTTTVTLHSLKHLTTPAYHPASNGLAGRAVQTLKRGLKKVCEGSLVSRITKVLFWYRISPHTTTGCPPAELLLRKISLSRLNLVFLTPSIQVEENQTQQKLKHNSTAHGLDYFLKQTKVLVENFPSENDWIYGEIVQNVGPVSFVVKLNEGQIVKCHMDICFVNCSMEPGEPPLCQPCMQFKWSQLIYSIYMWMFMIVKLHPFLHHHASTESTLSLNTANHLVLPTSSFTNAASSQKLLCPPSCSVFLLHKGEVGEMLCRCYGSGGWQIIALLTFCYSAVCVPLFHVVSESI